MPEMDGPTATQAIRARERVQGRSRTPIIALTASAMSHQIAEYLGCGMDDFVSKPIEVARLLAALLAAMTSPGRAGQDAPRRSRYRFGPPEWLALLNAKARA